MSPPHDQKAPLQPLPTTAAVADLARRVSDLEAAARHNAEHAPDALASQLVEVMDSLAGGAYPEELVRRAHALVDGLTSKARSRSRSRDATARRRQHAGRRAEPRLQNHAPANANDIPPVDEGEALLVDVDGVIPTEGEQESLAEHGEGDEENWPPERVERQLLRRLYDAIVAHLEANAGEPSLELEIALENAKCELASWV